MVTLSDIFSSALGLALVVVLVTYIRRVRELERKVTLLLTHFKIDPLGIVEPSQDVLDLLADPANKIAAIKAYRRETGADLAEAARAIEKLSRTSRVARA